MTGARLSDEQRLDWLQLIRSENVGPRTFRTLINRFGGARAALESLPDLIRRHGGGRQIRIAQRDVCLREYESALRIGARFLVMGDREYPPALREIDSPPPVICVMGDASAFTRPMVAIVGSRNASAAGLAFTERLAHELAEAEFVIASGLARGVDQRAHRASLKTGTIAVLAGGLDRIYPPEHAGLAEDICARGAVISEMPLGWEPRGRDFPRRNRIVSGLALATVVVEAARRSGSLITARFANEQGREVFAVPGSPLDPRAEGCNDLLRNGATLCTSGADVIEALAPVVAGAAATRANLRDDEAAFPSAERLWDETDLFGDPAIPLTEPAHELDDDGGLAAGKDDLFSYEPPVRVIAAELVESLLGPSPVAIDDVVRASGLSVADVHAALFDLELAGKLARHGGSLVALKPA
ncbi:MAG: DNA-processing protein DprA [Beijerinckiaceae bacterium]